MIYFFRVLIENPLNVAATLPSRIKSIDDISYLMMVLGVTRESLRKVFLFLSRESEYKNSPFLAENEKTFLNLCYQGRNSSNRARAYIAELLQITSIDSEELRRTVIAEENPLEIVRTYSQKVDLYRRHCEYLDLISSRTDPKSIETLKRFIEQGHIPKIFIVEDLKGIEYPRPPVKYSRFRWTKEEMEGGIHTRIYNFSYQLLNDPLMMNIISGRFFIAFVVPRE
jgi:hypothetical protein